MLLPLCISSVNCRFKGFSESSTVQQVWKFNDTSSSSKW